MACKDDLKVWILVAAIAATPLLTFYGVYYFYHSWKCESMWRSAGREAKYSHFICMVQMSDGTYLPDDRIRAYQ